MNFSGIEISRPAPSPLRPSASTPPRCARRFKASRARSTISCKAVPPSWVTKPTPQASWSIGMRWFSIYHVYRSNRQESTIENFDDRDGFFGERVASSERNDKVLVFFAGDSGLDLDQRRNDLG